jgi:acyl carrier protein
MGLDIEELVLEIEDTFSIRFPDEVATRIRTVGEVYDYVLANTNVVNDSSACLSAIVFYSLRRGANSLGVARRLRPGDSIYCLLPETHRRRFWTQLADGTELKLPGLTRPRWLIIACMAATGLSSAMVAFWVYQGTQSLAASAFSFVGLAIAMGMVLGALTAPFAVCQPREVKSLRGLAESVLGLNFKRLSEKYKGYQPTDVWMALRAIIVDQLGVSPDLVKSTATFTDDLGCE